MMAAVAAPPAVAGAPTIVTVSGTVPGNNLAIVFPASDPFVVSYPSMPFVFSAVVPGGAPQTASVRVWIYRHQPPDITGVNITPVTCFRSFGLS
jgi:hypothetical protein